MEFKQITETCIYIKNIQKTKAFYYDLLELPIISIEKDRHIFFRAGSSVLLCFIPEKTKKEDILPPHFGEGHLHLAFEVKKGEYEKWKEKISSVQIPIIHEQIWDNHKKSFYFKDPDGHLLEVIEFGLWV